MDYQINPVLMGGQVKEIKEDGRVKINLFGRLGVICVPGWMIAEKSAPRPGDRLQFYFSYLQVVEESCGYDSADLNPAYGLYPTMLGGLMTEVNDTAVMVSIMDGAGTVAVPRRWVFTDVPLREGQNCEFYFSCMKAAGDRQEV